MRRNGDFSAVGAPAMLSGRPVRTTATALARPLAGRFAPIAAGAGSVLAPFLAPGFSRWRGAKYPAPLGRLGDLEVRLAVSSAEVKLAQALRYRVFYEEMSAIADFRTRQTRRDADRFDRHCDHLLVIDHGRTARRAFGVQSAVPVIVGTYRLLRREAAEAAGGFYSSGEFDLSPLLRRKPGLNLLELGRSCVLPDYRNKRTLELLWHGIWAYVLKHGSDLMIGCASLQGTNPEALALPLSFLHHNFRAPGEWQVAARAARRVEMNLMPGDAIDTRTALRSLPPLIKGYLRLGAHIGDGAVIDRQFGTTDVCIILPVERIASRYVDYYGPDASRYAVSGTPPAPRAAA